MLKQANPANVEAFEILKTRFNRFDNILQQSIKGAKTRSIVGKTNSHTS